MMSKLRLAAICGVVAFLVSAGCDEHAETGPRTGTDAAFPPPPEPPEMEHVEPPEETPQRDAVAPEEPEPPTVIEGGGPGAPGTRPGPTAR